MPTQQKSNKYLTFAAGRHQRFEWPGLSGLGGRHQRNTHSDIAAKTLRAEGKNPSQMEILKRAKEIAELNKEQIKDINLIKPGMKLRLPGDANETDAERVRLRRQAGTSGPDQSEAETERLKRQGAQRPS